MTENGSLEEADEAKPGEQFADKLIRYSPRQITLEPGRTQTVRLLVRKPRDLAPGEYRSHLLFQSVPPADFGTSVEAEGVEEGTISVQMIPTFAISIPIIIRHGDVSAGVTTKGSSPGFLKSLVV